MRAKTVGKYEETVVPQQTEAVDKGALLGTRVRRVVPAAATATMPLS